MDITEPFFTKGNVTMLELRINEPHRLIKVAHALASDVRINILNLLSSEQVNIVDIAEKLRLPVSTVAANIKVLESAGLIVSEIKPATRGTMKVCSRTFNDIHMNLNKNNNYNNPMKCYEIEIPVGSYTDCSVEPTCGFITGNGLLEPNDDPTQFFHPDRLSAQLVWFRKGFLEYKFPMLHRSENTEIHSIEFSMEICSEAPNYDRNWPSDITIYINGQEIGTWTCPGDFGDRRGKLNPEWLPDNHTQYGLLKAWKVDNQGSYLDEAKLSDVVLSDLRLDHQNFITLRVEVKSQATNIGGVNIFGKSFGDHPQDIVMRIMHS